MTEPQNYQKLRNSTMAENPKPPSADELQACFDDLKKHSMSYKLGREQSEQIAGGEVPNPLHKQFALMLTKLDETLGEDATELSAIPLSQETQMIFSFQGLNVESHEYVPTSTIANAEEARQLFGHMQKWIKRARLFYTLRDYPLQYVNLSLDVSEMYRFVASYEEDLDSQYAVQKRRYDALEMLSSILKEVRPSCYIAVNVELMKELVEVQMELMNLNLKKLYSPPQGPEWNVNEDILRKKMEAFASFYKQLENVTSFLNTSDTGICSDVESAARNQETLGTSWFLPTDRC